MRLSNRLLFTALLIVDRTLGTHLAEKELARREAKVVRYKQQVSELEEHLARLEWMLESINLRLCLLYLQERSLMWPDRWLRFDPADPGEEHGLDLLIEHLVKPRLATIDTETVTQGHSVYHIQPRWEAIRDFFVQHQADLEPGISGWLAQQAAP